MWMISITNPIISGLLVDIQVMFFACKYTIKNKTN